MELHFIFHSVLCFQPVLEQLQALDGIDGVHRPLERKMHIVHLQQKNDLIENPQALVTR